MYVYMYMCAYTYGMMSRCLYLSTYAHVSYHLVLQDLLLSRIYDMQMDTLRPMPGNPLALLNVVEVIVDECADIQASQPQVRWSRE